MVWVGTDQGLYSFDGRNYWKINRPDGAIHEVTAIAERSDGEIWTGFDDGYIQVISSLSDNRVISTDSLKTFLFQKILFDPAGDVYIATYGKGIWRIRDNQVIRLTYTSLLQTDDVYDAILDHHGRIWLATDRGIWIYQQQPEENLQHLGREQGLPDEIVTKLLAEKNGDVWIGLYDHGLGRYVAAKIVSSQ